MLLESRAGPMSYLLKSDKQANCRSSTPPQRYRVGAVPCTYSSSQNLCCCPELPLVRGSSQGIAHTSMPQNQCGEVLVVQTVQRVENRPYNRIRLLVGVLGSEILSRIGHLSLDCAGDY